MRYEKKGLVPVRQYDYFLYLCTVNMTYDKSFYL